MNQAIFWFRRDLRLEDNAGLYYSLKNHKVIPIFIFDSNILSSLPKNDPRVSFIYQEISRLKKELQDLGSDLKVFYGTPEKIFTELSSKLVFSQVWANEDYEPKAIARDQNINKILNLSGKKFNLIKDQVIFNPGEVLKPDGSPYTVYTHYSRNWKNKLNDFFIKSYPSEKYLFNLLPLQPEPLILLNNLGFVPTNISFPSKKLNLKILKDYKINRDIPSLKNTSNLSVHLRFGTISVRTLIQEAILFEPWINELIWREFFMNLLFHFPHTINKSFKEPMDSFPYDNNPVFFKAWIDGKTGVPLVDAGMRELNQTGLMHNRVRMVVASFLCKNLLIDWRWGERYFAEKLLDFDLSANIGNWQWVAGSGCDAQPFFRIFNPETQQQKFDPDFKYIKKWIPEWNTSRYPSPIVDLKDSRLEALTRYSKIKKIT